MRAWMFRSGGRMERTTTRRWRRSGARSGRRATTEFDRYARGEEIAVAFHAITVAPVFVGKIVLRQEQDGADLLVPLAIYASGSNHCTEIARGKSLLTKTPPKPIRGRLIVDTC